MPEITDITKNVQTVVDTAFTYAEQALRQAHELANGLLESAGTRVGQSTPAPATKASAK
jgi:hypothetical protein